MSNTQRCQHHAGTGPWRSISFLISIEGFIRCYRFLDVLFLMGWNIFTDDLGMRGLNRIHWWGGDSSGYWKSWTASSSHQWQYDFSSELCPQTSREISNMGSQWLLSWTTTGRTRLRSLFLRTKLILALSWTRGNTRVEKFDYLASFSCLLTNVSSQINWWDSPPTPPLCSMALQGVSNTWGQDASSPRTFVGGGFTVLPRNSYIFNLPILETAHK